MINTAYGENEYEKYTYIMRVARHITHRVDIVIYKTLQSTMKTLFKLARGKNDPFNEKQKKNKTKSKKKKKTTENKSRSEFHNVRWPMERTEQNQVKKNNNNREIFAGHTVVRKSLSDMEQMRINAYALNISN